MQTTWRKLRNGKITGISCLDVTTDFKKGVLILYHAGKKICAVLIDCSVEQCGETIRLVNTPTHQMLVSKKALLEAIHES
jgi:hypothetical protein